MSKSETPDRATRNAPATQNQPADPDVPAYVTVLTTVSLSSSMLFAAASVLNFVALITLNGYDVLVPLLIGLPVSLGGSIFLALIPALIIRCFMDHPRISRSLGISGASVVFGGAVWLWIASMF